MKWPSQGPDLNLTENVWKILGDKVMAKKSTTVTALWKRLEEEWTKITPEHCERLVISCGHRWTEVIQSNFDLHCIYAHVYIIGVCVCVCVCVCVHI